ncbi:HrpP [Pseudomonas floridensis]
MPSGEKRPAASVGRGDSHAGRSPADGSLRDDAISADGLFFSQLLVPPVSEEPDQQSFAGGSLDFTTKTEPVPAQLIDELSQRLPQQPVGPLNFTLLMPNLGQVRVNAEKTDNRWNIQLGFSRRDVLKRVNGQASACRDALAQALGHDVDLDFHEDLDA